MEEQENKQLTRRERRAAARRRRRMATPFFAALCLLTVLALAVPLRPTESESEKRALAAFPTFSAEALFSGDYFDGVALWFADTFPGREGWLRLAGEVEALHGLRGVVIHGELGQADEIPDPAETPPAETTPPSPTATPAPTPSPTPPPPPEVVETSPPEESVEHWGGIEAGGEAEVIFGNVLQIGDAAFAYYGFSQYGSDRHVKLVNACAEMLEGYGVKLYDLLIPTSVGVLVSSDFMEEIKCSDQGASISYIFSQTDERVGKVNVFNSLVEHNDEYLYFRTDHHWTALGAWYAYAQFCAVAGLEAVPLEDYTELDMGSFLGSFYSTCAQSSKLLEDNVVAYDPPGDLTMKITSSEGNTFPWPVITDMSASSIYAKYMCFLGGDHPLTVITNNDLPDAPNCVVIKDSFGNPFVPYLTQHYHNVYVIDYRKYSAMTLQYFVQYYEIDEVLLVESLAMAQGEGTLDLLEWFCK